MTRCWRCQGAGNVLKIGQSKDWHGETETCPQCHGTGKIQPTKEALYQVDAPATGKYPAFTAGVVVKDNLITEAAPILKKWVGSPISWLEAYSRLKHWQCKKIERVSDEVHRGRTREIQAIPQDHQGGTGFDSSG